MLRRVSESAIFQRFWAIAGAASIRIKVLGIVLGVVLLLGVFVILQVNALLTDRLLDDLAQQGMALSAQITQGASEVQIGSDSALLTDYLQTLQTHYSDASHSTIVSYLVVVSPSGAVVAAAGASPLPTTLQPYRGQTSPDPTLRLALNDQVLEISSVLADGQNRLRLGLSLSNIERTVENVLLRLITITLVMVGVGFAAAVLLIGILTRPILGLVEATNALERGEFNIRVERWADDEIGELASAFNAMTASLQAAEAARAQEEALRRGYVSGVILAQENERQRIARELHDSTSQSLTSLLVGLQNLKWAEDADALNQHIDELRAGVGQTLDEVRTLSWRLRPNSLDDLGLVSALQQAIHDFQSRYGIQIDYAVSGMDTRVTSELEITIYRIVQEALTNIARHAQPGAASVLLSRRQDLIRIVVEDDGVGFDPQIVQQAGNSLGLHGIRERALLFNGNLTIESQPGQGTSLFVEIPYPDAEQSVGESSIAQTAIEQTAIEQTHTALVDADATETGSTHV